MEFCTCGSQKPSDECCIPFSPPILQKIPPFISSYKIHTSDYPLFVGQVRVRYGVKDGPGILAQVDPVIAEALGFDLTKPQLSSATERNTLIFPLHAVRYHQQQFMNRLRFIQSELLKMVDSSVNDARIELIQCEDIPLRCEFEAFISRTAAYLDAMGHYIANTLHITERKHGSHHKIQKYLDNEHGVKRLKYKPLRETYMVHQDWTKELFSIRHQIVHEGMSMDMTVPDDYFETKRFNPILKGKSVEGLVISFWKNTLELTRSLMTLPID